MLSGLVVCNECGATFHGHTSTRGEPTRRRYYRHGATPVKHGGKCTHTKYVRAEELENAVDNLIGELLADDRLVAATRQALDDMLSASADVQRRSDVEALEAALARITKKLERL